MRVLERKCIHTGLFNPLKTYSWKSRLAFNTGKVEPVFDLTL